MQLGCQAFKARCLGRGRAMSGADFIVGLLTIVTGLAICDMIVSLHGLLINRRHVKWDWLTLVSAAFVLLATIPFTYSISHGIGYGFITFVVIKVLSARWRSVHPLMYAAAAGFAGYFIFG